MHLWILKNWVFRIYVYRIFSKSFKLKRKIISETCAYFYALIRAAVVNFTEMAQPINLKILQGFLRYTYFSGINWVNKFSQKTICFPKPPFCHRQNFHKSPDHAFYSTLDITSPYFVVFSGDPKFLKINLRLLKYFLIGWQVGSQEKKSFSKQVKS